MESVVVPRLIPEKAAVNNGEYKSRMTEQERNYFGKAFRAGQSTTRRFSTSDVDSWLIRFG